MHLQHRIFTAGVRGGLVSELCPLMQDEIAHRRRNRAVSRAAWGVAFAVSGSIAGALLAGCSSMGDNPLTIFADPGKYQYNTCEQIAGQRTYWSSREKELRM